MLQGVGDCAATATWADERLAGTTVAFVSNLLFPRELTRRLGACLAGVAQLRAVATLRRFPEGSLPGFEECGPCERCEMSWTARIYVAGEPRGEHPGAQVHIYTRRAGSDAVSEMRALIEARLLVE